MGSGLHLPPPFGSPSPALCPSPGSLPTSRDTGGAQGGAKEDSGWAGLPFQRVIRSRSQSMDAMGLSGKRQNTVTTSHSGSFGHHSPDIAKATGLVSAPPSLLPASPLRARFPALPFTATQSFSAFWGDPHPHPNGDGVGLVAGWAGVPEQRPISPLFFPARGTSLGCSAPEWPLGGSLAPA